MGCDIHGPVVEVRAQSKDGMLPGVWRPKCEFHMDRNYKWFSRMADVRTPEGQVGVFLPRGLPSDATWLSRHVCEDCHSASWLGIEEILALFSSNTNDGYLAPLVALMLTYEHLGLEVRAVFAFDS